MKKAFFILILIVTTSQSQNLKGNLKEYINKEVSLITYDGITERKIAKTSIDSLGNFILEFPSNYRGAALFSINEVVNVTLILNNENLVLQWVNVNDLNSLKFVNSNENELFLQGIVINQKIQQKLVGLRYLLPQYANTKQEKWLKNEINLQEKEFNNYLNKISDNSYVKYYLSLRKLLVEIQFSVNQDNEKEQIVKHEEKVSQIDFSNNDLWHSGVLKNLISSYYQLLEKHEKTETINEKIMSFNSQVLKCLERNSFKQQEVAEYCFKLLEEKNFTKASEHIALSMLNQENCTLDDKRTDLFEQYRKLAIGKTAPDIDLTNNKKLSTINTTHKLVAFGASWCPNCQADYPSLVGKYKTLKELYDLEIIYISIDTDKNSFESYYKEAPFITFCDAKGWETQAAKAYHIFATPTYILLDKELKIKAKIKSPEHLEEWLKEMID